MVAWVLGQFNEEAHSSRIHQLSVPKRLVFSSGNVVINAPQGLDPNSFLDRK